MKFQSTLNNLVNLFTLWKNWAKSAVTYVTKCMAEAILKTVSIKQKVVNVKKHSPTVWLSNTLYCHQCSLDFTYFVPLARELSFHSWLKFHENGPKGPLQDFQSLEAISTCPSSNLRRSRCFNCTCFTTEIISSIHNNG